MKKSKTPNVWTSVTPFSKIVAAILFIALPILAFLWGMRYQLTLDTFVSPQVQESAVVAPLSK